MGARHQREHSLGGRHGVLEHGGALVPLDAEVLLGPLLPHDNVDVAGDDLQDLLRLRGLHRVVLVAARSTRISTSSQTAIVLQYSDIWNDMWKDREVEEDRQPSGRKL